MNKKFLLIVILLSLILLSIKGVNALQIADASTSYSNGFFNVTVADPTLSNYSINYSIYINITRNLASDPLSYNVLFYIPYGMRNLSACNGANGFRNINFTFEACTMNITIGQQGQTNTTNINITSTISAFTALFTASLREYVIVNVTSENSSTTSTVTINPRGIYGQQYWINPRPYATVENNGSNATLKFEFWQQTRPKYEAWVPLYSFNATGSFLGNNIFNTIIYANKPFFENPDYLEMYAYQLNFTIYNATTNGNNLHNRFTIKVPRLNYTNQMLTPLQSITNSFRDPMSNRSYNQSIAIPAPPLANTDPLFVSVGDSLFDVFLIVNQTGFIGKFNNSYLSSQYGINITFNSGNVQGVDTLLNVTMPTTYSNITLGIMFTLVSNGTGGDVEGRSPSPLYINSQSVSGWDPLNSPPTLGSTINNRYTASISNRLENFTLSNLVIKFVQPKNVSLTNITNSIVFNTTINYNLTIAWKNTSDGWTNTTSDIIWTIANSTFKDNLEGSISKNETIEVTFYIVEVNLNSSNFSYWQPNQAPHLISNITVNMTSVMVFPTMSEYDNTPGTEGSKNTYNVTTSMSVESPLVIPTSKLSGLTSTNCPTSSTCGINFTIDGIEYPAANFTIGSITTKNRLSASTHSISVTYTVPSSSSSSSSSGAGSSSSSAGGTSLPVNELQESKETVTPLLARGESFRFKLNEEKNHTLTILSIDNVSVKIRISSEPIELTFKVNEEKEVDLNNDTINDISIKLEEIKNGIFAKFSLKKLVQKELQPGKEGNITEITEEEIKEVIKIKEGIDRNKYYYIIFAIIVIVILILYRKFKEKNN